MNTGKGIAIAGIWIGVGASAFGAPQAVDGVAFGAVIATIFIALICQ